MPLNKISLLDHQVYHQNQNLDYQQPFILDSIPSNYLSLTISISLPFQTVFTNLKSLYHATPVQSSDFQSQDGLQVL